VPNVICSIDQLAQRSEAWSQATCVQSRRFDFRLAESLSNALSDEQPPT
jgi:hypothetical protein